MNYKVTVAYDGTNFHGWAKQHEYRTVQQTIEEILQKIFKQKVIIAGSGRTDAYVHANAQVFSFKIKHSTLSCKNLLSALNALAPEDITFKRVSEVDDDFHARFSAKSKTYRYVISKEKNIFKRNHELQYDNDLNIALIKKTFPFFVGEHDFKSFSTSDNEDTIRKINYIKLLKKDNEIIIEVNGSGFLRNMVRIIVASIIDVNEGKKDWNDISNLINNPKKGSAISKAKGCGLYLHEVKY